MMSLARINPPLGLAQKLFHILSIPASGYLCPIFGCKILEIARYSCGFAASDRTNLTQIRAPKM